MLTDLPDWLPGWCLDNIGSAPVHVLFRVDQMSSVIGLRLTDDREVVVKARPADGRATPCIEAQAALAARGFPCPRPLTGALEVDALVVHAEEFRPGGEVLSGDSPAVAVRYAEVFAWLMAELAHVTVAPPLPNPRWIRWDHRDSGVWPASGTLDERDQALVPEWVVTTAERARARLLAVDLPCVLGHADFEAQNLRWDGPRLRVLHDWDSLAWQPEAALVGAASAVFPKLGPATLPPMGSTETFLGTYQELRGRRFTADEEAIAWAASVWTAAHDIRWESLHGYTAVSGGALWRQATERLRRADA